MFGVGVSQLEVYDWPAADGLRGGSPHLHTLCSEAYVVTGGAGAVQTLTHGGYAETPLRPGAVVSFTPGTVHRLVNSSALRIVVVMQNSGLPEAGDAVFTFPPEVLRDPAAYEAAATGDVRQRRDLAVEGFLRLRDGGGFEEFLSHAARIVGDRLGEFERRWREGPLASALATGDQLAALREGDVSHLKAAGVSVGEPEPRLGMCGYLNGALRENYQ